MGTFYRSNSTSIEQYTNTLCLERIDWVAANLALIFFSSSDYVSSTLIPVAS